VTFPSQARVWQPLNTKAVQLWKEGRAKGLRAVPIVLKNIQVDTFKGVAQLKSIDATVLLAVSLGRKKIH